MIRSYFTTAWRNITKRSFYSLLNIIGLSTGIVFTFLIGAYVWNELNVNKKLRHAGSQYFLKSIWKNPNQGQEITTFAPLAKRLKEDYPNLIENYYRWDGITSVITKGNQHLREGLQVGDSTLLSMYGLKLLEGNAATAFNEPFSAVITKEAAIKYFGKTNIVGESIGIQNFSGASHNFTITGVLDDIPENSVLQLNDANHNQFFIPVNTATYFGRDGLVSWANMYTPSYIEIKEGVQLPAVEMAIARLLQQNAAPGIKDAVMVKPLALTDYYLQKDNGLVKRMLYALSFVGLFILLMAIINFINIAISSSSARIKEIGIRKVLGGLRKQIILQFLAESVILVLLSTIIALVAYPFLQPVFAGMVGKAIPGLTSFPLYFIFIPVVMVLGVGVLAGIYPAIVLSSLKSVDSIKGKLKSVTENVWLRKSLAGLQFGIAVIVMIAAFIVSQQVAYFFGQGLGYDKEFVVASQVPRDWSPAGVQKMETVRNQFAAIPEVAHVSLSYEIPNGNNGGQPPVYKAGTDSTAATSMQLLITDENYVSTYQVPLAAGEFFDSRGQDSGKVIMNATAVKALGYTNAQQAIGQQVRVPGDATVFTIKGVTNDFHFGSMQQAIAPIMFFNVNAVPTYRYLSFKLKPGNISHAIAAIEKKWASLLPGSSFEYTFMDDTLKKLYKTEIQLQKAANTATVLCLIIVLMGVLGLVSLSIQKRTKEIGIRKVLGSSVSSIMLLFMKEFLWIVAVAGIVVCPVAWLIMNGWLNDYVYRVPLTAMPFIVSIAGLAVVTILLIGLQTIKAGLANPVQSLRTE